MGKDVFVLRAFPAFIIGMLKGCHETVKNWNVFTRSTFAQCDGAVFQTMVADSNVTIRKPDFCRLTFGTLR